MPSIFVIDRNLETANALCVALQMQGFEVTCQRDYKKALEQVSQSQGQPDVIICDMAAPPLDGISLLEHVRNSRNWYQVPFILLTPSPTLELQRHAFNLGADALIAKPLRGDTLINTLRNLGIFTTAGV